MPIQLPAIDDRDHAALVRDTLALAAVHAPEWTHTGPSDPGVTLVELFAFMAESLLYRANLIPERNRLKFLQLLGIGLQPAQSARGLVQFFNEGGERKTLTLPSGLPLLAGAVPFRSEAGFDLPPVSGLVMFKRLSVVSDPALLDYYRQLYDATGRDLSGLNAEPQLYDSVALADLAGPIDLGRDTVDGALWIALLAPPKATPADRLNAREQLAGRTLSIGLIPAPPETRVRIVPGVSATPAPALTAWCPLAQADGSGTPGRYRRLDAVSPRGFPDVPGLLQVSLPANATDIGFWPEAEPLEAGVGDLPPPLTDEALAERLLGWLRIDGLATVGMPLDWAGIHCAEVSQRSRVERELLLPGDGSPEQRRSLSRGQVLSDSLRLTVAGQDWTLSDALEAAPAEGLPGARLFALDAESGVIRFGDGAHGERPPAGAEIAAGYDSSLGPEGNVAPGAIKLGPSLPPGVKLSNPRAATGGIAAESAAQGEKRIPLVLRHRDRAVSADDFEAILRETPQADVGRVEVLPAWHPELSPGLPGDQPGVVTCMVIPRVDPLRPNEPLPSADFINALCAHLAPRRLVTCEVLLRGPVYAGVWISVGVEPHAGQSVAELRARIKLALRAFLAPLPGAQGAGWPLFKAVAALELATTVARVEGVLGVTGLLLGDASGASRDTVAMSGLQLPRIAGLSVTVGDPVPLSDLIGGGSGSSSGTDDGGNAPPVLRLPVPRVPGTC